MEYHVVIEQHEVDFWGSYGRSRMDYSWNVE